MSDTQNTLSPATVIQLKNLVRAINPTKTSVQLTYLEYVVEFTDRSFSKPYALVIYGIVRCHITGGVIDRTPVYSDGILWIPEALPQILEDIDIMLGKVAPHRKDEVTLRARFLSQLPRRGS